MNLLRLTLRSVVGSPFRSGLVFLCVVLVAGSAVWATLVVQGAQESLRLGAAGMDVGADIVILPREGGYFSAATGSVNLTDLLDDVAAIPGVARAQVEGGAGLDPATDVTPVILVEVEPGSETREVARRILRDVPGVTAFDSADFFQMGREQTASLLRTVPALLGVTWGLSVVFIGLAFAIAANERRREVGVLRALGSSRALVLRSLLTEGLMLALGGGVLGAVLSALAAALFRDEIVRLLGLPLVPPPPLTLLALACASLALALLSATLAVLVPAWKASQQDPAVAMRG